ncbi:hypothetical protein D3C87_1984980 [compost metagenome]
MRTSCSGSASSAISQMPVPVPATNNAPSEHCATAKRMSMPAPFLRKAVGVMPRMAGAAS